MLTLVLPIELWPLALPIYQFTVEARCDVCNERRGLCVRVSSEFSWLCLPCWNVCLQSMQPVFIHSADARCRAVVSGSSSLEVEDSDDMVEVEDSDDGGFVVVAASLPDPLPPRVSAVPGAPWYMPRVHFRRAVEPRKYGFTEGCRGCIFSQAGITPEHGHSEQCRNRIGEAMKRDRNDTVRVEERDRRRHKAEDARSEERAGVVHPSVDGAVVAGPDASLGAEPCVCSCFQDLDAGDSDASDTMEAEDEGSIRVIRCSCMRCPGLNGRRCRASLELRVGQLVVECFACIASHTNIPPCRTRTSVFTDLDTKYTRTQFLNYNMSGHPITSWRSAPRSQLVCCRASCSQHDDEQRRDGR
jgi:hypothetical protein